MVFGHSIFLWGLATVPLPLLLHLFFRRKKARVPFSTLAFFRYRHRELSMRRRIREWLVLLLRTLALLLLTLALAQPLSREGKGNFASRTRAVILLDDTASMSRRLASGRSAFELAKQRAGEVLETLKPGDSAALLLLSGQKGVSFTRDIARVRRCLEETGISGGSNTFRAGLKRVGTLLAMGRAPNQECYLISDFQKNQCPGRGRIGKVTEGTRLFLIPLSGGESNLSLDPLKISSRPRSVNVPFRLPYSVLNRGTTDRETRVRLLLDGQSVLTEPLMIPAGERRSGSFDLVPDRAGFLTGSVEIDDPAWEGDNCQYFALPVQPRIRVILLESSLDNPVRPFTFLRAAIDPVPGRAVNGIETRLLFFEELEEGDLEGVQVVVAERPGRVPDRIDTLLTAYLKRGGSVIGVGGQGRAESGKRGSFSELSAPLAGTKKRVDARGILFREEVSALNDLVPSDLLRWKWIREADRGGEGRILAEVQGEPLWIGQRVGEGYLILSMVSFRRDAGNWPELKAFPIAMVHLIFHAAQNRAESPGLLCGDPIRYTARLPGGEGVVVRDGRGRSWSLEMKDGHGVLAETWQSGLYRTDQALPARVAVNPVPSEGEVETVSIGSLERWGGGKDGFAVSVLSLDQPLLPQIAAVRRGEDLTGLFLVLSLLSFLAENWLVYRRYAPKTRLERQEWQ